MYWGKKTWTKFSGSIDTVKITSTIPWIGILPKDMDEEIKNNVDEYTVQKEEVVLLQANDNVLYVEHNIVWEHNHNHLKGRLDFINSLAHPLDENIKNQVLQIVATGFGHESIPLSDDEEQEVSVIITNTEGVEFNYRFDFDSSLSSVSSLLRQLMNIPSLALFDGNGENDRIKTISIEVNKPKDRDFGDSGKLTLDMNAMQLDTSYKSHQFGCDSTQTYTFTDKSVLYRLEWDIQEHMRDALQSLSTFKLGETNHFDSNPSKHGIVTVRITWEHKEDIFYVGNIIDRYSPQWYSDLLNIISTHINPRVIEGFRPVTGKQSTHLYKYCSVHVFKMGSEFYYRTDRSDIRVGDIVKVPFGYENDIRTGRVESISFHNRQNVPYDLKRTKFIMDKEEPELLYDCLHDEAE